MANTQSSGDSFDSGQQYLGGVYAKALLGVTQQAGTTAQVLSEFDSFLTDVLGRLPSVAAVLESVRVKHADREQLLERVLRGRMSPHLLDFLKVVSRHGRMNCLRVINRAAHRLYDELCGRLRVTVTTAVALAPETVTAVTQRLAQSLGKEIVILPRIDPEVLGGLVIQIGDKVYDSSVRNQLSRLRDEILSGALEKIRSDSQRFVKAV